MFQNGHGGLTYCGSFWNRTGSPFDRQDPILQPIRDAAHDKHAGSVVDHRENRRNGTSRFVVVIYRYQRAGRREIRQKEGNTIWSGFSLTLPHSDLSGKVTTCQELKAPAGIALGITRVRKPSRHYTAPSHGREAPRTGSTRTLTWIACIHLHTLHQHSYNHVLRRASSAVIFSMIVCLSVCRFVNGNVCRKSADCFV